MVTVLIWVLGIAAFAYLVLSLLPRTEAGLGIWVPRLGRVGPAASVFTRFCRWNLWGVFVLTGLGFGFQALTLASFLEGDEVRGPAFDDALRSTLTWGATYLAVFLMFLWGTYQLDKMEAERAAKESTELHRSEP